MKTANVAGPKFAERAAAASGSYLSGAQNTTKDQSAAAIAAKAIWQSQLQAAIARGAYEKGLQNSGKAGWLAGVQQKGQQNYQTGVSSPKALSKYVSNSGKYDSARGAANSLPRGPKGSPANIARVTAVVNALHAAKVGS